MARTIFIISSFLVGLTCLVITVILIKYRARRVHAVWAAFNIVAGIWGFGAFLIGLASTEAAAAIFWKIALFGSIFSPILFYHTIVLVGELRRKAALTVFYLYGAFFYSLTVFDLVGLRLDYIPDFIYYVRATDWRWGTLVAIWTALIFCSVFELYRLYRHAGGVRRIQYQYLLLAFAFGFSGALLDTLPFFGFAAFPAANAIMSVYSILVAYAILRHKLLEIEVIIRKTLVFAGLLASTFAILILPTVFINDFLFRAAGVGGRIVGLTISGIIIIFSMRRIEDFLINVTDRYLFQKKYDYRSLLKTFTTEVLTVLNITKLVDLTVDKLFEIIKPESCVVFLLDGERQTLRAVACRGNADESIAITRGEPLFDYLDRAQRYILRSEFSEKKISMPSQAEVVLDRCKAELLVPLILQHRMIGALALGKKKSDVDYSQDDLDILLPLARTLAIAIANAQLFDELGKTQAEAAQKEKMAVIGTLSAGINHEICNPLGIARGQCEAFLLNLRDGLYKEKTTDELFAKAQEIMTKVIKEVDRATVITKRLSSFAKPAKGESEAVPIAKEVDDVLGLVGYELKLEKIELVKEIDENLPAIFVDRKQFQEVLFNLIRNAGQAIGEKGRITIAAREERGTVTIDIRDTGSGIPPDKVGQLFNPFFTTKEPGKGTGLGLFIVRQVVEKNGGRIYLKETKVGVGTTFTIEFPAAHAAMAEAKAAA